MGETIRKIEPTKESNRIEILDILRGIALFGILLVNMRLFGTPGVYLSVTGEKLWDSGLDKWTDLLISIFAEGKFYSMFSFLFGISFIIFMNKAEKKVKNPYYLFVRRLLGLLIIGSFHLFFVWYGDVLTVYSILGLLLLAFYKSKPKTMVTWAFIIIFVSMTPFFLITTTAVITETVEDEAIVEEAEKILQETEKIIKISEVKADGAMINYSTGSYADVFNQRLADIKFVSPFVIIGLPMIFPMFLLGAYAGKRKLFHDISSNILFFKKAFYWSLIISFISITGKLIGEANFDLHEPTFYNILMNVGDTISQPALCFLYISAFVLLIYNKRILKAFKPFANSGRMALTNYLIQSTICTYIFYGYGLGFYGKVGPFAGLFLTITIYGFQLLLSTLWLRRFKYGPVEKLWRFLTYGKV